MYGVHFETITFFFIYYKVCQKQLYKKPNQFIFIYLFGKITSKLKGKKNVEMSLKDTDSNKELWSDLNGRSGKTIIYLRIYIFLFFIQKFTHFLME